MSGAWERIQPCTDWRGQVAGLRVVLTDKNLVGLHTPAGEFAGLTVVQCGPLIHHVNEAVDAAVQRGASLSVAMERHYHGSHEVYDHRHEVRRVGVAAHTGEVRFANVPTWFTVRADAADGLADSIHRAAAVARQQALQQGR